MCCGALVQVRGQPSGVLSSHHRGPGTELGLAASAFTCRAVLAVLVLLYMKLYLPRWVKLCLKRKQNFHESHKQ